MPWNAFRKEEEFLSGRVKAEPTDWPLEFRLKLLGAYRWLPYAIKWKFMILSRFARAGAGDLSPLISGTEKQQIE
jgi:hypothetical protein